jgi:hypothetical protein
LENNSRRDPKMQNSMHELSYGDKPSKKRSEFIAFFTIVPLAVLLPVKYIHITGIIATLILMVTYMSKNSEPKQRTQPIKTIKPTYNLTHADLICMLRNAQEQKQ